MNQSFFEGGGPLVDLEARLTLANLLARTGRGEEARREYREALRREPGSWEAAEAIFRLFESQGRLAEAVPLIRQGLAARGGNSPPHLIALGYMALQRDDLEAAGDPTIRLPANASFPLRAVLAIEGGNYREDEGGSTMTKIAVATNEARNISQHFGRSTAISVCPATMFANRRIASAAGLMKWPAISTTNTMTMTGSR